MTRITLCDAEDKEVANFEGTVEIIVKQEQRTNIYGFYTISTTSNSPIYYTVTRGKCQTTTINAPQISALVGRTFKIIINDFCGKNYTIDSGIITEIQMGADVIILFTGENLTEVKENLLEL